MGLKRTWTAEVTSVSAVQKHKYEDEGRRCVGLEPVVRLLLTIKDGPEAGRQLMVDLSPNEARLESKFISDRAYEAETAHKSL